MWEVWVGCRVEAMQDGFYDAFATPQEAKACADEFNEFADESYAYVVLNTGE